MLQNRYVVGGIVIGVLLVANIISFFSGWGLITVHAHEVPLSKVIKSIESQGWVSIYTNIDPTTPISMDVVQVPLAEAMESVAANIPPPDNSGSGPRRGGGVQWKLAFFAAPTSAEVKQEIRTFQGGDDDPDTRIYSYPTPLQMLASDSGMPAADPRLQVWSGVKQPPPAPAPPADSASNNDPDPAPAPPSTAQDYLDALAQGADIWIMSPSTWEIKIPAPPDSGLSIAKAVKSLVSRAHGAVEQAFVLYSRPAGQRGPGGGGRGFVGGDTGWSYMEDRMRNAINGLPPEARPEALNQLAQEDNFQKQVRAAAPDQRRQMMRAHFMARLGNLDNWRRSPERRAQMYQRAVSNRQTVRGS